MFCVVFGKLFVMLVINNTSDFDSVDFVHSVLVYFYQSQFKLLQCCSVAEFTVSSSFDGHFPGEPVY